MEIEQFLNCTYLGDVISKSILRTPTKYYARDHQVPYDSTFSRMDLINRCIKHFEFDSYLEIGVSIPEKCFDLIDLQEKIGVDPDPAARATHCMTSDDFFEQNTKKFDLVFVDGLHEREQVIRDIENSLDALKENGLIICHDMNPAGESNQLWPRPKAGGVWNGNCWEAWVTLRKVRNDVQMFVINADEGLGVVRKGSQKLLKAPENPCYRMFSKYRREWLNLTSTKDLEMHLFR
ncbi:MAG: hypothetical protein ACI909_003577 [Planctomycetota bacterium]|jgi:hypothetical protein